METCGSFLIMGPESRIRLCIGLGVAVAIFVVERRLFGLGGVISLRF